MINNRGFTLLELLLATVTGVVVVGIALGVYRSVAQSESMLNNRQDEFFRYVQTTEILNRFLFHQTGPVIGTSDRIVFLSDLNILGYGREMIYISSIIKNKSESMFLKIVPVIFSDKISDLLKIKELYDNPDSRYLYSHKEVIKNFIPKFFFSYNDDRITEILENEPDYLKIILRCGDFYECVVAETWQ